MAGTTVAVKAGPLKVVGFQQITVLTSAVALTLTAGTPGQSQPKIKAVLISPDGQSVRVRFDTTAPTAAIGHLIANGDHLFYVGDLAGIKIIQTAATAVANVTYFA